MEEGPEIEAEQKVRAGPAGQLARAGPAEQEARAWPVEQEARVGTPGLEQTTWAPGLEQTLWAPGLEGTPWAPGLERTLWAPGLEWALERTLGSRTGAGSVADSVAATMASRTTGLESTGEMPAALAEINGGSSKLEASLKSL